MSLIEEIKKLKKEKNAIILAHCYQNIEIDEVADFVGDSLALSREAAKTDADIILFAGVKFMAETAKILSPDKKVLLPRKEAGCPMADMIDLEKLIDFKSKYSENIPVVCYVNSTAEIKANSDICCTSANAVNVVKSLNADKVLFVPDKGLGGYVNSVLPDTEVISFHGFCPTHLGVSEQDVITSKEKHPEALVLVHPECQLDVIRKADFVGSTTEIINFVKNSNHKSFIIVTEKGVYDRLKRDYPSKEFFLIKDSAVCKTMKLTTLEDILYSLKNETEEIKVDETLAKKAFNAINRMLEIKK